MRWPLPKDREPGANAHADACLGDVLGLLFGLVGVGEYPEDRLRVVRNHINERPASGDIVLVGIDESLKEIGRWPWPRGRYAELIEAIDAAEADGRSTTSCSRNGRIRAGRQWSRRSAAGQDVTLGYQPRAGAQRASSRTSGPFPKLPATPKSASIGLYYNYANEAWTLRARVGARGRIIPSFGSIAGRRAPTTTFPGQLCVRPYLDPVSARPTSDGRARQLQGQDGHRGPDSRSARRPVYDPGWGKAAAFISTSSAPRR